LTGSGEKSVKNRKKCRYPLRLTVAFISLGLLMVTAIRPVNAGFIDRASNLGMNLGGGGPSAWGDYNNDGWVDVLAGGILWKNNNGTSFTQVFNAGVGILADYNNDGHLDIFAYSSHQLHKNTGAASFVSQPFPALPMVITRGACWLDHDGDGDLDLYVGGYESPGYEPDVILRNNDGNSFTQVWQQSGDIDPARGITACDFDRDGDLDIFVSNYRLEENLLWRNQGNGNFTNAIFALGANEPSSWGGAHTIGSAWGDLDNDGNFDLFVGNFAHPANCPGITGALRQPESQFLRNLGLGGGYAFEDKTGTANLAYQESYATPTLGDYDNDGDLDLFFTTVYNSSQTCDGAANHAVLYRNDGNWSFTDVTTQEGLNGLPPTYQAAWADYDNDGDLDLITAGRMFQNQGNGNHWLKVRLEGDGACVNRSAIGAQVRITSGVSGIGTPTRQVEAGTGEGNQNDMTLHFGLGSNTGPLTLEISWPGGDVDVLAGIAVDQLVQHTFTGGACFIVGDGLECYLDFTENPGGTSVIDQTGNGNNATLVTGPDPDGGGPATGVPHFEGTGIRFFGGWIDIDPTGLNSLGSGTIEIIYDDMPITDNAISTGTPLSVANAGNTGRDNDWEIWVDHRTLANRAFNFNGRVANVEQINGAFVTHHMTSVDTMQREQHFAQWDGATNEARLVSRFFKDGVLTVDSSPWVSTGTMPDFLTAATNIRFGGRNTVNDTMEGPHYRSVGNILRVYDRVLTDAEMLQNWDAYNGPVPIVPTTCQGAIAGGFGIASDLDGDCYITVGDLRLLAIDWLRCVHPDNLDCEQPLIE
jgi:hypothetical protein